MSKPVVFWPAAWAQSVSSNEASRDTDFDVRSHHEFRVWVCLPTPEIAKASIGPEDLLQVPLKNAADLTRAARVNRLFSEQALSLLWRTLFDIKPLLQISSSFKFTLDEAAYYQPRYAFLDQMSTAGWERMAWYAMRVRKLYCRLWGLDHRVLLDILDRTNGKPLFPALEVLFLDQEPLFHKELLLFISPNLRYFEVVYVTLNQYPRDPRSHCPTEETLVFDALLRLPRRLQTFRLRSCKIMPSNLDRHPNSTIPSLEVLDLVYMNPYTVVAPQ
ncbi:hypothetical protein NLI96_g7285 [Meripilus lineatus]|uniref:F-box domain-containing protein n=1 Tax=Meripilus lineatus TaxID=2056292 RepID=A0AAD5YC76_9APHY|nr:hypothetical protein NLI96_g7285 [Physisporinus lineatus]